MPKQKEANSVKLIRLEKNLQGKKVFVRSDFNVPIKKGKIMDDYRLIASLPTIRFLQRYKAKIILCTHLGQPKERDPKFSTKPISAHLSRLLGTKVFFVDECVGHKVKEAIAKMHDGDILMLENIRFEKDEETNDTDFAKKIAAYSDIYVNNAFGASHRAHASLSAIKKFLPSYAGLLVEQEVVSMNKVINPKEPLIAIIGGAKIKTKIRLIESLAKKARYVMIGGALANNFLAAHGLEVGKSMVDEESIKLAGRLKIKNLLLPIDVVVGSKMDGSGKATVKSVNDIGKNDVILDIGPETIRLLSSHIKKANTIVWNGPMGMFESERFKHGTIAIAQCVASRASGRAFAVVGGGETVEAVKLSKMIEQIDWVSTGGGAMLTYLGGEKMPGLKGLI